MTRRSSAIIFDDKSNYWGIGLREGYPASGPFGYGEQSLAGWILGK
ncbi:MAG: hypothetical protein OSA42_09585 [Porticoccaceae bacterium]|nr:hypothetical protein [Porticoccaceae bacterium]